MVKKGDLTGGGEHTPQHRDGVLWKCTPETCIPSNLGLRTSWFSIRFSTKLLRKKMSQSSDKTLGLDSLPDNPFMLIPT